MVRPLIPHSGLTLADNFLIYSRKNWLESCPIKFWPFFLLKVPYDTFVLFNLPEHCSVDVSGFA